MSSQKFDISQLGWAQFERAIANVVDQLVQDQGETFASEVRSRLDRPGSDWSDIHCLLDESGVGAAWRHSLRWERSRELADWLAPYIDAPLLDVHAGDESVAGALVVHGIRPITAVEHHRLSPVAPPVPGVTRQRLPVHLGSITARTTLFCTVLHHVRAPVQLLAEVAQGGSTRWIVVENCIGKECGQDMHILSDLFYNRALTSSTAWCGSSHATHAGWRSQLSTFGAIVKEESRIGISGMLFPYTLFIVERCNR